MKTLSIIAVLCSIAAMSVAIYTRQNPVRWSPPTYASPQEIAEASFHRNEAVYETPAERVFRTKHKEEIAKTMVVADILTSEDKKLALLLVRYEADGRMFRRGIWARNLTGEWIQDYTITYSDDAIATSNKGWIEEMEEKKKTWEKDSASIYSEKEKG